LRRRGGRPIYGDILAELRERDRRDSERAVAPLRVAPDALVLDTTRLEPEATFEAALRHVEALTGQRASRPQASGNP
jgi:cytidylate kinase